MTLAANVKSQLRSCADLSEHASQLAGTVYERLGSMNPKDLESGIARRTEQDRAR